MKNLNVKLYELRFKSTNELIVASISENAVRKEWISMREEGDDMSNVIANQTFVSVEEWNNSMNEVLNAAIAAK